MTANTELIQKKLPQELWQIAGELDIPDDFLDKEPDLTVLILNSKSLATNTEKQNWFNLIPMMNHEQIEKLRDILTRERDKIAEIEAKYEQKKQEIKETYGVKFNATDYNDKISKIRTNEENLRSQEMEEADSLLDNI